MRMMACDPVVCIQEKHEIHPALVVGAPGFICGTCNAWAELTHYQFEALSGFALGIEGDRIEFVYKAAPVKLRGERMLRGGYDDVTGFYQRTGRR